MKKTSISKLAVLSLTLLALCGISILIFLHPSRFSNSIANLKHKFSSKRPNVIMIMVDALRRDHLGVYGYDRPTSPNIDRFAKDAIVFKSVISQCSWTNPSITSFFSSLYPSTHGVLSYRQSEGVVEADSFPLKIMTVTELFQKKGYATAGFVANHWIEPDLNFDQGFDVYDTISDDVKPRAEALNHKALKWIVEHKDEPFFAYLHYMDVHGPYTPPEPYRERFNTTGIKTFRKQHLQKVGKQIFVQYMIDLYDGEIAYADHHIGQLLDRFKTEGILENTIVIITADHGEAFMEHGHGEHGWTLYNEEINVPLIIKFPDKMALPNFPRKNVLLIDIPATLAGLIGARYPYKVEGINLLRTSQSALSKRNLYTEELAPIVKGPAKVALIQGAWKAIYRPQKSAVTELYNLDDDPGEDRNLVHDYPKKSEELKGLIEKNLSRFSAKRQELDLGSSQTSLKDQQKLDKLKSLGYLQ